MNPTIAQEMRARTRWGCTHQQYMTLRCKPMRVFQAQRKNARLRGIGWELTLWQWWTIWQDSGHWNHRGSGQGYVMCREGDVGSYVIGNVFIAPSIENVSDRPNRITDLPIGVICTGKRYRARRMMNGKHYRLGLYETPELAHAAYLSLGPIGRPSINVPFQFVGATPADEARAADAPTLPPVAALAKIQGASA